MFSLQGYRKGKQKFATDTCHILYQQKAVRQVKMGAWCVCYAVCTENLSTDSL